jgi:hypothetical protein
LRLGGKVGMFLSIHFGAVPGVNTCLSDVSRSELDLAVPVLEVHWRTVSAAVGS